MAREFAKRFYKSKAWQDTRKLIIERDNGLCQKCLTDTGEIVPGDEVHHKIWLRPTNINNPDITLNPDNLILLCRDCHIRIHKESTHKKRKHNMINNGMYLDEHGNLQRQKVFIVHGAPGSGKTTYVKEHMDNGDLIVDLDNIKQAISLCNKTEAPDNLLDISNDIKELLYKRIESKEVNAKTIWVIAGLPTRKQRSELASRLHAELIHIDTDISICIERILLDDERKDKEIQMKILDSYFAYYEAPLKK